MRNVGTYRVYRNVIRDIWRYTNVGTFGIQKCWDMVCRNVKRTFGGTQMSEHWDHNHVILGIQKCRNIGYGKCPGTDLRYKQVACPKQNKKISI